MGDAGEGLVDAESRIAERMEELERERLEKRDRVVRDPEAVRTLESLKLARRELDRQLHTPAYERRRKFITEAIAELDRQMAEVEARIA
jgi:hypothetical protein